MQRRRFIKILASSVATLPIGKLAMATRELKAAHWNGYTLGAEGSITLYNQDSSLANTALKECFTEIRRLEKLFSLYDHRSELSILNRDGVLHQPSPEWLPLLQSADSAHTLTQGLFDPTIQPLWKAYQTHFAKYPNTTQGPDSIQKALNKTGWRHMHYTDNEIRFNRPNMQVTLNGIAQGFITDRVSELLKAAGYKHVLVELGETRAVGAHPEGRTWSIGIKDATAPTKISTIAELNNQALATSGSYGSPFSKDSTFHHLIHPKKGTSCVRWKSLSVIAPTAVEADALSTGLSFADSTMLAALKATRSDLQIIHQA